MYVCMSSPVEPLRAIYFLPLLRRGCWLHPAECLIIQSVFLQSHVQERRHTVCSCAAVHTRRSNFGVLCNRQALTLLSLQQRLCNKLKSIFLKPLFHPCLFLLWMLVCVCVCLWGLRTFRLVLASSNCWLRSGFRVKLGIKVEVMHVAVMVMVRTIGLGRCIQTGWFSASFSSDCTG